VTVQINFGVNNLNTGVMKKMFILLAMLAALNSMKAQSCLPEGITFTYQSQINSFQSNYPNCTRIEGNVNINGPGITNLLGLSVLTSIGGNLMIECNEMMTSLHGLHNISSIGGNLYCQGNLVLTSLDGFDNLGIVGGDVVIANNIAMSSLPGLSHLAHIGGMLFIDYNNALTSLTGLNNVVTISSNARISSNSSLSTLSGLEGLTFIGGSLVIGGQGHLGGMGNPSLTSLNGLHNVTGIGGGIEVGYNAALPGLDGLDNISAGSVTGLSIYNNPELSFCEVQSVCDYLAIPNGTVQIYNNAAGCNSREEVEAACALLPVEKLTGETLFSVFPNPSSNLITVEQAEFPARSQVVIMNFRGQELIKQNVNYPRTTINIIDLPYGVYFVRLINDKSVHIQKLIKQ
jgi:hypothetical protein